MRTLVVALLPLLHSHIAYSYRIYNGIGACSKLQRSRSTPLDAERNGTQLVRLITPPPNLTGELHVGNALNLVCSDIYLKYCELTQKYVCVRYGCDHAGLGLERIINRRHAPNVEARELLHDAMRNCRGLTKVHLQTIRKLGIDWLYSTWTLSTKSKEITRDVFVKLYKEGHITERPYPTFSRVTDDGVEFLNSAKVHMVNCPVDVFSITLDIVSDDAWDGSGSGSNNTDVVVGSVVAYTTKPALLHATAAVAVEEEEYERYKGKMAVLPESFRRVPLVPLGSIIKDDGTVNDTLIMPGYSENVVNIAYSLGLEVINIVDSDGRLTNVPSRLMGLSLKEAETALIQLFKHDRTVEQKMPTLIGEKECEVHTLPAPHFLLDVAAISGHALQALEHLDIDPPNRMSFLRQRLESKQPWCISRNGWWGIRVPIWYLKKDSDVITLPVRSEDEAKRLAAEKLGYPVDEAIKNGYHLSQDTRTLDTWFTSSLWPITSSMDSEALESLQPCGTQTILYTCYDILHSWVARMLLMCTYLSEGKLPFDRVVLHGMVNDSHGKKMSKSIGNTVTANDFVSGFGALYGFPEIQSSSIADKYITQVLGKAQEKNDPLAMAQARLSLAASASKANMCHDIGDYDERIKSMLKKIGQITNYMSGVCSKLKLQTLWDLERYDDKELSSLEAAIVAELSRVIESMSELIEAFEFRRAVESLELYVSVFSNYAIPAHRHGNCRFNVLFRWYTNLLRVMMPFAVQLVRSMPLPLGLQQSDMLMQWPDIKTVDERGIKMFAAMEDIIRQLRRHAHDGSTVPEVSAPEEYRADLESHKSLLAYIVQLTYNTTIDFNIK